MNARKLLFNEKVEVRQIEEGLKGSWYSAVVVGISDMSRVVEYNELLCETEDSKLVESIPVTGDIEGVYQRPCVKTNHRGRIRPLPSTCEAFSVKDGLSYGFCVDVLFEDAWWEGIIFDSNDGADKRSIFFPDEGDVRRFKVSNLRATHEWDEFSGAWRKRGVWTLVKLIEECTTSISLAKFTKFVWSHLRINYGFQKMISEWTCGAHSVWKTYFIEVVSIIATKSVKKALGYPITSQLAAAREKKNVFKSYQSPDKDVNVSNKTRRNDRSIQLVESKPYCPSESNKIDSFDNGGANGNSTQTDAPSKTSYQIDSRRSSNNQCNETPNTCSVGMGERPEDVATTSGRLVQNSKRQSQIVLSRRKMQKVENNLALQKRKSLARQQQLLRFQSNSPRKHRNVVAGLRSRSHGNNTQHFIQRQLEESLVLRYSKCNLRMLSFGLRKKRSCLKVKKRFPKKIQRSNAKNKLSCSKEGLLSELSQKEYSSLDTKATCQQEFESNEAVPAEKKRSKKSRRNDPVCFVCQYGDDLLPCDNCTSSYHKTCIGLEELPGAKWFCPSCRCGLCGLRNSNHWECLSSTDISVSEDSLPEKFCSRRCFQICVRLHEHLQTLHPIPVEGLSWTITRSRRNDYNFQDERIHPCVQLSPVMKVLHECFEPTVDPQTKKDLISEVVYNSSSKFKRLDFHGFYVMVLQHGEDLACVATLRVHGHKVAEMPLIATPFKYRRKGMCRLLMREMEKMLIELGVERLVLPAISQLRETWVNVFGFKEMPDSLRQEFSGYPFLVFSGTTMFHKECEDDYERRFGSCYKRNRRNGIIITKDNRAIQCLNYNRSRKRPLISDKERENKQGLYYTRRRRAEAVGRERTTKQGSNRNSSPIKYFLLGLIPQLISDFAETFNLLISSAAAVWGIRALGGYKANSSITTTVVYTPKGV
ncbi:hypothetical protein V2J09_023586 [Rumex salicifolius]